MFLFKTKLKPLQRGFFNTMISYFKNKPIVFSGFLVALIGALLFSTKAVIVKHAFMHTSVDAITLLALRMLFALPIYIGIAFFAENKKSNIRFTKRQWVYVISLGLSGYYLSSLWDFVGLQYISAGLERLILFLKFYTFLTLSCSRFPLWAMQQPFTRSSSQFRLIFDNCFHCTWNVYAAFHYFYIRTMFGKNSA